MNNCILIVFSAKPNSGSENGVGWRFIRLAAKKFEKVKVYIRESEGCYESCLKEKNKLKLNNIILIKIKEYGIYKFFKPAKIHSRFLHIFYMFFQISLMLELLKNKDWQKFDVLMHPTWVSDWFISPAFLLPFPKKIVGPMASQPANFNRKSDDFIKSIFRMLFKYSLRIISPVNFFVALDPNSFLIFIDEKTQKLFPWNLSKRKKIFSPICSVLTNNSKIFTTKNKFENKNKPVDIVFIGKNLGFKNPDLFLDLCLRLYILGNDLNINAYGHGCNFFEMLKLSNDARKILSRFKLTNKLRKFNQLSLENLKKELLKLEKPIFLQTSSERGGTAAHDLLSMGIPVICFEGYGVSCSFSENTYPWTIPYFNKIEHTALALNKLVNKIKADYNYFSEKALKLALTEDVWFEDGFKLIDNII